MNDGARQHACIMHCLHAWLGQIKQDNKSGLTSSLAYYPSSFFILRHRHPKGQSIALKPCGEGPEDHDMGPPWVCLQRVQGKSQEIQGDG